MNVLLLIHGLRIGGSETMVCALARDLRQRQQHVEIGCLDEVGELGEELRNDGFTVRLFGRRAGFDCSLPLRLAGWMRAARADVVHAHQRPAMSYGVLATCVRPVPLVYTEHGPLFGTPTRRSVAFNRTFGRRVRRITAVADVVRRSLLDVEGFAGRSIAVLPNAVDTDRFAPAPGARSTARRRFGLPPDAALIGCIGRFAPAKNQALLLQALVLLRDVIPNVAVALVGEGSQQRELQALAARLHVGDRVFWLGLQRHIEHVLPAMDVVCLPSCSEGIPLTLLEAMSMQIPIVASRAGGIPEAVCDGVEALLLGCTPTTATVADSDGVGAAAPELADALARVLSDAPAAAQRAAAARRRVLRAFSLPTACDRYFEVLSAAI